MACARKTKPRNPCELLAGLDCRQVPESQATGASIMAHFRAWWARVAAAALKARWHWQKRTLLGNLPPHCKALLSAALSCRLITTAGLPMQGPETSSWHPWHASEVPVAVSLAIAGAFALCESVSGSQNGFKQWKSTRMREFSVFQEVFRPRKGFKPVKFCKLATSLQVLKAFKAWKIYKIFQTFIVFWIGCIFKTLKKFWICKIFQILKVFRIC